MPSRNSPSPAASVKIPIVACRDAESVVACVVRVRNERTEVERVWENREGTWLCKAQGRRQCCETRFSWSKLHPTQSHRATPSRNPREGAAVHLCPPIAVAAPAGVGVRKARPLQLAVETKHCSDPHQTAQACTIRALTKPGDDASVYTWLILTCTLEMGMRMRGGA